MKDANEIAELKTEVLSGPLWTPVGKSLDARSIALRISVASIAAGLLTTVIGNIWVVNSASARVYTSSAALPINDVGLLLGAGVRTSNGGMNPFFKARTEAAAMLYHTGKIRQVLVSGDNHSRYYDEPTDMKNYLVTLGVPASAITLDYAGFRTLDSMARANQVFGLDRVTIITDQFHAYRGVFLGLHYRIDAIAYCSAPVPLRYSADVRLREVGARVKALLDCYLLHRGPRFLGPPIKLD